MKKAIKALKKPLSMSVMRKAQKAGKKIQGIIKMSASELVCNDEESVLDIMSERLTGGGLLEDFSYKPVGVTSKGEILMKIVGSADAIVDDANEQEL